MIRRSIVSIPAKATTRRQARPAPADDHGPVRTKSFSAGAPDSGNPFWRVFLAYSPQWLYETDFRSFPGMLGFDKTRSARSGRLPTLDNPTAGSSRFSRGPVDPPGPGSGPAGPTVVASVLLRHYWLFQSPSNRPRQGAVRREWPALCKDCNAELVDWTGSRRAGL